MANLIDNFISSETMMTYGAKSSVNGIPLTFKLGSLDALKNNIDAQNSINPGDMLACGYDDGDDYSFNQGHVLQLASRLKDGSLKTIPMLPPSGNGYLSCMEDPSGDGKSFTPFYTWPGYKTTINQANELVLTQFNTVTTTFGGSAAQTGGKQDVASVVIPFATRETPGIVSVVEQSFAGDKNFTGKIGLHLGLYQKDSTTTIDRKFIFSPPKDYKGEFHGTSNLILMLPERIKSNKIYFFDENQQLTDGFTIEEVNKKLTVVDKGHYINNTKIAINSTSEPTENLYVNGESKFNGVLKQQQPKGSSSITRHHQPYYGGTSSTTCIQFDFGDYTKSGMFSIELKGNSYDNSGKQVLHSVYQFYNYNGGKSWACVVGRCFGKNSGPLHVYRDATDGHLKAWLFYPDSGSTMSITTYISLTTTEPVITYSVARPNLTALDQTQLKTITPRCEASISEGGTGRSTLTDGALLIGAGTNAIEFVAPVAKGQILMSNGTSSNPIFGTPSMSWTNGTAKGPVFNYSINGVSITGSAIPSASNTASGIVTTGDQTFAGNKTFTGNILPQTDCTQNIGSLAQSFNAIYAKALYLKGTNSKANYIVGNNPTDADYQAKLPNYNGNITISINSHYNVGGDGITCFIPFYSTKGEVIQYNNGLQYYTLEGTTTKNGYGTLILGNSTLSGSEGNKRGCLQIYGPNNVCTNIMAANLTTKRSVYIRDYGVDTTYFVGVDSVNGKGNATTPIYIANTGLATACSSYAGGTAITLNGTSKAASTASFYAPTSSGTAGYILKSGGANVAPSWIQFVPIANGGTGATSITANGLLYVTSSKITASSHYINDTQIAINSTSAPTENLYVNGSAKVAGNTTLGDAMADIITINGKTILKSDVTYGTRNPEDIYTTTTVGAATTPVEGQIYFKIIS